MPLNFVSLIRVSTNRQGDSGLGLEAQREAIRRHIDTVGGHLVQEHVEIESGRYGSRPILLRAIAQCGETKSTLILAKLDRLARNVAFVSRLMETKVDFIALDAQFANPLMLHIMAAFAEHERKMISARTKAALAAAKARGVVLGSFGKELAARNRADAQSFADSLRQPITAMIQAGNDTLQGLAENLDRAGILTREGATWAPTSVLRVLRRLNLRTPAMCVAA
jgi:DNA invertase Pin-like site-specific DNA recombinase